MKLTDFLTGLAASLGLEFRVHGGAGGRAGGIHGLAGPYCPWLWLGHLAFGTGHSVEEGRERDWQRFKAQGCDWLDCVQGQET